VKLKADDDGQSFKSVGFGGPPLHLGIHPVKEKELVQWSAQIAQGLIVMKNNALVSGRLPTSTAGHR
jgi:hypothetical protein